MHYSKNSWLRLKAYCRSFIRANETGGNLNYFTLYIRDKTMRILMDQALAKKFDSIFWITALTSGIFTIVVNVYNYIVKAPQSEVGLFLLTPTLGLMGIVWMICKCAKHYAHTSKGIILIYTTITCCYINFSLRDMMPPGIHVDTTNLDFFKYQDLIHFIISSCMLFHDVKWLLFLNGPIFLISSYFAVLAEVENA